MQIALAFFYLKSSCQPYIIYIEHKHLFFQRNNPGFNRLR